MQCTLPAASVFDTPCVGKALQPRKLGEMPITIPTTTIDITIITIIVYFIIITTTCIILYHRRHRRHHHHAILVPLSPQTQQNRHHHPLAHLHPHYQSGSTWRTKRKVFDCTSIRLFQTEKTPHTYHTSKRQFQRVASPQTNQIKSTHIYTKAQISNISLTARRFVCFKRDDITNISHQQTTILGELLIPKPTRSSPRTYTTKLHQKKHWAWHIEERLDCSEGGSPLESLTPWRGTLERAFTSLRGRNSHRKSDKKTRTFL